MQDPVRSDTHTVASRDAARSHAANSLVFELQQMAALLQAALAEEESRATVPDPSDPQYSMLARSLRARHDNLLKTISSLQAAA
jgi:hypothetical protein